MHHTSSIEKVTRRISHIPQDSEFQLNFHRLDGIDSATMRKIAATLSARNDIRSASVSHDEFLKVQYNPKGLSGAKKDEFIGRIRQLMITLVMRKMEATATV